MAESPHIVSVTQADFATQVIEKSRAIPVLVDFWAPWCGPCRALEPILAGLVEQYGGKLLVAKVNTDVEQELARDHGIRGIPALKLFRHGGIVGEFVGVQPEAALRDLIERFVPSEADALVERAAGLAQAGNTADAVALLRQATAQHPHHDRSKLELARLLCLAENAGDEAARAEECRQLLNALSVGAGMGPEAKALRSRAGQLRVVAQAAPLDALHRTVAADPDAHTARLQLGARLALAGEYEAAMGHWLELVRRERGFGDDAARKMLIGVFNLLGHEHPLVTKYRGLLSRALN